jgi:hypothetical protein
MNGTQMLGQECFSSSATGQAFHKENSKKDKFFYTFPRIFRIFAKTYPESRRHGVCEGLATLPFKEIGANSRSKQYLF